MYLILVISVVKWFSANFR